MSLVTILSLSLLPIFIALKSPKGKLRDKGFASGILYLSDTLCLIRITIWGSNALC